MRKLCIILCIEIYLPGKGGGREGRNKESRLQLLFVVGMEKNRISVDYSKFKNNMEDKLKF